MKTLVPLDLVLFSATAAAFVGHLYYKRKPCRRARTQKQVSFRMQPTQLELLHPSIAAMMPLLKSPSSSASPPVPPIIGLLFAASWCPDCFDVVPRVGNVVAASANSLSPLVEVIYVASDTNESEMLKFKPATLQHISLDAVQERSDLKRKFRTCAAKEMEDLRITDRKKGIPTLILLDSSTGRILTETGVDDVMKGGSSLSVLSKWRDLLSNGKQSQ